MHNKHNRRDFLKMLGMASFSLGLGSGCSNIEAGPVRNVKSSRPNIIFIMIDDLGWMDLHCQGNKLVDTPNIDRLARQSMRFTDGYAAAPVCSPTRAAMMTGQAPARTGITNHSPGNKRGFAPEGAKVKEAEDVKYLSLNHVTIAERLKKAGYATGFIGKWHLSRYARNLKIEANKKAELQLRPEHQGYDVNKGGFYRGGPPTYFDPYSIPGLPPRETGEYLPERLADESIAFMKANKDRPFFLTLWNYAVHYPLEAPGQLLKKYQDRKGPGIKDYRYAAMIEGMDAAIGRVLKAVDDMQLTDDTLVIFTSDNGGYNGDNRPLRAGKGHLYEGGIRVPWIIRFPGVVKAGTVCSEPVISMDVYPTLLDFCRLEPEKDKPLDGESLMPLLRQQGSLKRDAIYFHYPNYAFHKQNRLASAIRQGKYKLLKFYDNNYIELYDLSEDIGEKSDLSKKLPEKAKKMTRKLDKWLKDTKAKLPTSI